MTSDDSGLDRAQYDEHLRRQAEAVANEPTGPLDVLEHLFEGKPDAPEYLAPVRDLLSESPQAAEAAAALQNDGLMREGLAALLALHSKALAGELEAEPLTDLILRFSQAVAQTRLMAPTVKSTILGSMQGALGSWAELGAKRSS